MNERDLPERLDGSQGTVDYVNGWNDCLAAVRLDLIESRRHARTQAEAVGKGLAPAMPLERIAAAYQFKRHPEDYADEWRECSKETFGTIRRTEGSPWIARELFAAASIDAADSKP